MSMELLRLGLQFFAGETKEEEEEVIIPGEEGVTGASGVTGSTPPAYTMPQNTVAAPVAQDFDTWYKANGGMDEAGYYAKYDLDPDRDYQNTVNTLNYEYQTSMANYGEQAEKMYQMGLQNSGVSDIFQANAFSSYLGNMNQAAADRITARKKNKAAFNDYLAGMRAQHGQYETGIKTEYDTKLNSALTYAMSKYNGYNLQDVLNALGVSGYYTEIVDEVGKRLSGMDATSLQATTETVLAQDIINNISGFTGSENDLAAAKSMYGGMYGEDVIEKAFGRAKTIYQNSAAGQDAILNGYIDQYYGNYTGDINTLDLSGIEDEGMREKVKTGIQQRFEADKTSLMSEILKLYPNYTASADENATIDAMFGNKYGANVLAAAKSALESLYKSGEGYENTQVQGFIDQYYGNYTGDINTLDLSGIEDEGMREKVKKGIEEKFRAQVGKAITAIGNWLNANGVDYSGTSAQKDAIKAALGFEYGTNELEYALSQYDTFGTYAKEEYANSPEGIQAKADEHVTTYGARFDPNVDMDTFIKDVMKVDTTDKESAKYKAAEAAWKQMKSNYEKALSTLLGAGLNSNSTNEAIQTILNNAGISFDDKMIERLRASLADTEEMVKKEEEVQNNAASIAEIDKIDKSLNTTMTTQGYLTTYDYMNAYKEVEAYEAENGETEATKAKKAEYREKILAEANGYLSGDDGYDLKKAGDMLTGFLSQSDVDNWDSMSDDARRRAIISAAKGEVSKKSGLVTASELYSMVSLYVTLVIEDVKSTGEDALANAGNLISFINKIDLNGIEKNKLYTSIAQKMNVTVNGTKIQWTDNGEATIGSIKEGEHVTDSKIIDYLNSRKSGANGDSISAYDGKLYLNVGGSWLEVAKEDLRIIGDWHTNSQEEREGIYEMLVFMFGGIDSGYVQGELPTSTTVTGSGDSEDKGFKTGSGPSGGGHTKDFATQNK